MVGDRLRSNGISIEPIEIKDSIGLAVPDGYWDIMFGKIFKDNEHYQYKFVEDKPEWFSARIYW